MNLVDAKGTKLSIDMVKKKLELEHRKNDPFNAMKV